MRRITHAAVYELTWSQYLRAVEDGSCKFPLTRPDGGPLNAEERRRFDVNWTAGKLRLGDVTCFKSWVQRRLPAGYIADLPTATEWIWLAKAGASEPKISAQTAVLLESESILGSYGLLAKPRVPATKPNAIHSCGLVGRMPSNAWGLFDVIGNEPEITSGIISLGNGRFAPIHIVELRGGGCLTPVAKVPIHTASNGVVKFDDDTVLPTYAVRLVVIQQN